MSEVTITVGEDGPYLVEGDITLTDDYGRELDLPYTSSSAAADALRTSRSATALIPRSTSTARLPTDHELCQ
jgi:hypothetical protein